jgi:hypothetical protein
MKNMKYSVKVIFTYSVEPDNRKFYEESIYLVDAESFEDAYEKAEEYTRGFDLEHTNLKCQKVKTEKIDFIDCFLAFDEEDGVQEIYSATLKNKSSLSEEEFYQAITNQCDAEEMYDLRYDEFN